VHFREFIIEDSLLAAMAHPFQAICVSPQTASRPKDILFAACGPNIFSLDLEDGSKLSEWSSEEPKDVVSLAESRLIVKWLMGDPSDSPIVVEPQLSHFLSRTVRLPTDKTSHRRSANEKKMFLLRQL